MWAFASKNPAKGTEEFYWALDPLLLAPDGLV